MTDKMDGRYYAKDWDVFKAPLKTKREGGTTVTIGFKVCTVDEYIDPEDVAKALNIAEFGE